jgi:hypothetical protein
MDDCEYFKEKLRQLKIKKKNYKLKLSSTENYLRFEKINNQKLNLENNLLVK